MARHNAGEREGVPFSATAVVNEVADALSAIRRTDGLTFGDIAAVLGKSEDQASRYCAGSAVMDAVTFARAKREWGGRFTGGFDRLCRDGRPGEDADATRQSKVLAAALALSIALQDDNRITPAEVRANRCQIEEARDALDELLRKIVRVA